MRAAIVAGLVLAGCAEPSAGDARRAWIVDRLAAENLVFQLREADLVAGKLTRMQGDPHAWLRGTAGVFWRDLAGPGPWAAPTAFGDAASARVLIIGDPHLENLGSFRTPDGTMLVDWNDFDAAGYGPYWGDVRRLAVAVVVAARDRVAGDDAAAARLAGAVARGYADEIVAIAGGAAAPAMGLGADAILDNLLDRARRHGDELDRLGDYTRVDGLGARAMFFGDVSPVGEDGTWSDTVVEVGAARPVIERAIARWRTSLHLDAGDAAVAIKGASRRLGAGVASYPSLRYYVLLEGPTPAVDDDWLVELKETVDGPALFGPPAYGPGFETAGQRVVAAQLRASARSDEDHLLGWADLPPASFRVRSRDGYQRGLDVADVVADLAPGAAGLDQLAELATLSGRLLARAHARPATLDGLPAAGVIAPLLAGRTDGFVTETTTFAVAYATRTVDDWASFAGADLAAEVYP